MYSSENKETRSIIDARGLPVRLPASPKRIVSLICSITETLFDLGAGELLAGRTDYCIRPPGLVDTVPMTGGPKNPDIDRILALNPDLIIANIEENEKPDIEKFENAGIPVFVTYPRTVSDSVELIKTLAEITGASQAAASYIARAESLIEQVGCAVGKSGKGPRVLYLIWRKPYMSINGDTYIHDLIVFCGGMNVCAGHRDRYPVVSTEDISALEPDIIILPSEPFRFTGKHKREIMNQVSVPAVRNKQVILADGELYSWYGTRMLYALPYVLKMLTGKEI
ncbi:ABC transporter substrate-binding protein [candidate division KSB1 bacterium]